MLGYVPRQNIASQGPTLLTLLGPLSLVALIPSVEYLRGNRQVAGSAFCDAFGVMLVATIWTEHLWTLSLAAATYLILIHVC